MLNNKITINKTKKIVDTDGIIIVVSRLTENLL